MKYIKGKPITSAQDLLNELCIWVCPISINVIFKQLKLTPNNSIEYSSEEDYQFKHACSLGVYFGFKQIEQYEKFARELLIPEHGLLSRYSIFGGDIKQLAEWFCVPQSVMIQRILDLEGLIYN